jgi:hypothetical protein
LSDSPVETELSLPSVRISVHVASQVELLSMYAYFYFPLILALTGPDIRFGCAVAVAMSGRLPGLFDFSLRSLKMAWEWRGLWELATGDAVDLVVVARDHVLYSTIY